jgi:hypothetical protein
LQLRVNSRIYYLDEYQWLHEIYRFNLEDLNYTQFKLGQASSSLLKRNLSYIWERRSNLSTTHLNVIYINYKPFTMITKRPLQIDGYLGELFVLLQEKLKFNFTLTEHEADCWGSNTGNGTYNCMFGKLQSGQSSWSLAESTETEERSLTFDFSRPLFQQPKRILTRRPLEDLNGASYIAVFTDQFWLVLFISALVLSSMLYWILKCGSKSKNNLNNSFSEAICFTLLSLGCRELTALKASCSGKILILIILCWGFLISCSYNAILTSTLAVSKITPTIRSLDDLLNSKEYNLVLRRAGSTTDYFKNAPNDTTGKH